MVARAFSYKLEGIIIIDYLTEYKIIYEEEISTKLNLQPNIVRTALNTYNKHGILECESTKGENKK